METSDLATDDKPSGKRGALVAIIVLVAVLACAFVGYDLLAKQGSPATQGQSAAVSAQSQEALPADAVLLSDYDAAVYTESGEPQRFSEIAAGKPLVVNFWATWCPYCVDEMADFQQFYDDYGQKVSFAFVDCVDGVREKVEDGAGWMAEKGLTLPAFYDTSGEAVSMYGAYSLPTTVIVSGQGEILTISPGRIDPDLMRNALDSLVAGA